MEQYVSSGNEINAIAAGRGNPSPRPRRGWLPCGDGIATIEMMKIDETIIAIIAGIHQGCPYVAMMTMIFL